MHLSKISFDLWIDLSATSSDVSPLGGLYVRSILSASRLSFPVREALFFVLAQAVWQATISVSVPALFVVAKRAKQNPKFEKKRAANAALFTY